VIEEMLTFAMKQVREILAMPVVNSVGFVDTKLAELKLKAAMMLDMRAKGGYIQRSMQIVQSTNINENKNTTISVSSHEGVEDQSSIDDRIKLLEQEIAERESMVQAKSPDRLLPTPIAPQQTFTVVPKYQHVQTEDPYAGVLDEYKVKKATPDDIA